MNRLFKEIVKSYIIHLALFVAFGCAAKLLFEMNINLVEFSIIVSILTGLFVGCELVLKRFQWDSISNVLFKYLLYFIEAFCIQFFYGYISGYFKSNLYYEYDINFVLAVFVVNIIMFLYFSPWIRNFIRMVWVNFFDRDRRESVGQNEELEEHEERQSLSSMSVSSESSESLLSSMDLEESDSDNYWGEFNTGTSEGPSDGGSGGSPSGRSNTGPYGESLSAEDIARNQASQQRVPFPLPSEEELEKRRQSDIKHRCIRRNSGLERLNILYDEYDEDE